MKISKFSLKVPNAQAEDCEIAGVVEEVDKKLIDMISKKQTPYKSLLICSGGTTSRCASKGSITLDLRKNHKKIMFDRNTNEVCIESGVIMKDLINNISKENRSFPIGLSGITGVGYILTGGISPLSRLYGLAIDQVLEINGFWANGNRFFLKKPNTLSSQKQNFEWRALLGASPFLGIVTSLRLKTYRMVSIYKWEAIVKPRELSLAIKYAENWPDYASLFWIWGDKIKVTVVIETDNEKDLEILNELSSIKNSRLVKLRGIQELNKSEESNKKISYKRKHAEVIGLLGGAYKNHVNDLIMSLEKLMLERPDKGCYLAAQQLGGMTSHIKKESTSFIHREAIWKPWITGSWPAGNKNERLKSLDWMKEAWKLFKPNCPGIHLAQLHPHLDWHKEEIQRAYEDWLPKLQQMKSTYDPEGILPPL